MDKDDKVVPISENTYHVPGVQEEVVEAIEDVLAQAKRGEVTGIVISAVRANHEILCHVAKGSASYSSLVSAVVMGQFDLCHVWSSRE
jgi:hypothetical protein